MRDRVPTKPNRYAVYDDNHNFVRYEYHERADEPTQVGDALNKANLLPDEVAAALRLSGNPQVKDALSLIVPPRIIATAPTGSTVTCTKGTTTLTAAESSGTWTFNVPEYGTWTVNATQSGNSASKSVAVDTVKQYSVALAYYHIYGVEWDGTSSTALSRTDDAELFADPSPAVSSGNGSSPFDSLLPWSGMVKETRNGSVMVKIPKFWFKWTKTGSKLKLQIADAAVSGFSVSPAHMDRGDGSGERDYVYVGRYHCGSSAYKSVSGQSPKANITRSAARTAIHNLGTTTWQMDYAMRLTIQMLYLVEYADWNSQAKIGYGCGNNSAARSMGYTDSMTYHTGTTQSARTTYGLGTQYRWIEGLWDNVYDWMDGCYYNASGLNIIKNPANFSDSANGTAVGTPSSGYPTVMNISTVSGFDWVMYPTTANGSDSTYVPDYWGFGSSNPCLYVGGGYGQDQGRGLFYVDYDDSSVAVANIGCPTLPFVWLTPLLTNGTGFRTPQGEDKPTGHGLVPSERSEGNTVRLQGGNTL